MLDVSAGCHGYPRSFVATMTFMATGAFSRVGIVCADAAGAQRAARQRATPVTLETKST